MTNSKEDPGLMYFLEQDQDDQEITEFILKETSHEVKVVFFTSTQNFLEAFAIAERLPRVILLGNNIVPETTLQVVHVLKSNFRLMRIAVIVLGERATPQEMQQAYLYGASAFITKPFTNRDTVRKISVFMDYWFQVVQLPATATAS